MRTVYVYGAEFFPAAVIIVLGGKLDGATWLGGNYGRKFAGSECGLWPAVPVDRTIGSGETQAGCIPSFGSIFIVVYIRGWLGR